MNVFDVAGTIWTFTEKPVGLQMSILVPAWAAAGWAGVSTDSGYSTQEVGAGERGEAEVGSECQENTVLHG